MWVQNYSFQLIPKMVAGNFGHCKECRDSKLGACFRSPRETVHNHVLRKWRSWDCAYPSNVDGEPGGFASEDVEWGDTMDLTPRWLIRKG